MDNLARLLLRVLRVSLAYVAAVFMGFAVYAPMLLFLLETFISPEPARSTGLGAFAEGSVLSGFAGTLMFWKLWWPVLPGVMLSEILKLRSSLFHIANGLMATWAATLISYPRFPGLWEFPFVQIAAVTAAGLSAGLVYWLMAGRSAGCGRESPDDDEQAFSDVRQRLP